jgi:uncharacterized membrane protein YkvA (DUF1232 family)
MWIWLLGSIAALLALYGLFVAWLAITGRRESVRAVAGLVPDFVVLFRRLLGDSRIPRRRKLLLAAVIPYLAMPFDLVPDFIPVAGYLDDAVIVALVLRRVLRGGGRELVEELWPGPASSLGVVLRLAGYGSVRDGQAGQAGKTTPAP